MSESPSFPEPVFEFGGKVDEFHVTLYVHGEDLDPEEITRLLGTRPDESHKRGEPRYAWRSDQEWPSGHWAIDIRSGAPDEIRTAIGEVLDRVNNPDALRELTPRYTVRLSVGVFLDAPNRGFDLPASLVERIAKSGIELSFDIYVQAADDP